MTVKDLIPLPSKRRNEFFDLMHITCYCSNTELQIENPSIPAVLFLEFYTPKQK
jgi:hypothetical protein